MKIEQPGKVKAVENPAPGVRVISDEEPEDKFEPVEVEVVEELSKPGWKTTEFWLTLATVIVPFIRPDFPVEAVVTIAAYVLSRGLTKHGTGKKTKKK